MKARGIRQWPFLSRNPNIESHGEGMGRDSIGGLVDKVIIDIPFYPIRKPDDFVGPELMIKGILNG